MIDISGLVKVKPIHPGRLEFLFGSWWQSLLGWLACATATTIICIVITGCAYIGINFTEVIWVILKVVPILTFGLGMFCELMNWHNWKMRLSLYIAGMDEDYRERRMVL